MSSGIPNACAVNTTATPCIIDVPSMLMVAPSGIVKDEIFFETPIFSASVSIFIGMVAFEVEVENANAITGKKFLMKINGLSPENIFSNPRYTTKHCTASASRTQNIYFNNGMNTSKPISANVFAIRQNTPIGASFMTAIVISIIISLNCPKKFFTMSTWSPMFARITPRINANTMICSIFPSLKELKILTGIMSNSVSVMLMDCVVSLTVEVTWICDMSSPFPGLKILAIVSATVIASAVVHR